MQQGSCGQLLRARSAELGWKACQELSVVLIPPFPFHRPHPLLSPLLTWPCFWNLCNCVARVKRGGLQGQRQLPKPRSSRHTFWPHSSGPPGAMPGLLPGMVSSIIAQLVFCLIMVVQLDHEFPEVRASVCQGRLVPLSVHRMLWSSTSTTGLSQNHYKLLSTAAPSRCFALTLL